MGNSSNSPEYNAMKTIGTKYWSEYANTTSLWEKADNPRGSELAGHWMLASSFNAILAIANVLDTMFLKSDPPVYANNEARHLCYACRWS